jgi:hypothetical protein
MGKVISFDESYDYGRAVSIKEMNRESTTYWSGMSAEQEMTDQTHNGLNL